MVFDVLQLDFFGYLRGRGRESESSVVRVVAVPVMGLWDETEDMGWILLLSLMMMVAGRRRRRQRSDVVV